MRNAAWLVPGTPPLFRGWINPNSRTKSGASARLETTMSATIDNGGLQRKFFYTHGLSCSTNFHYSDSFWLHIHLGKDLNQSKSKFGRC